jgi:lysophospholipase L1-like esterase
MKTVARFAAVALALSVIGCAGEDEVGQTQQELGAPAPVYLTIGDSIPFGYNPTLIPANNDNVYLGYPQLVGEMLDKPTANASCPGETTQSFWDPTAIDNGCDEFRAIQPLHEKYAGTQMEYLTGFLATHSRIEGITLQLGANDVLMLLYGCYGDMGCVMAGLEGVLQSVGQNLGRILYTIRAMGYQGKIVMPLYYSTDYADQATTGAIYYLNQVIAQLAGMFGAVTADSFGAFYMASYPYAGNPCAAGLLLPKADGTCDKHPSAAGAQLLANMVLGALQ